MNSSTLDKHSLSAEEHAIAGDHALERQASCQLVRPKCCCFSCGAGLENFGSRTGSNDVCKPNRSSSVHRLLWLLPGDRDTSPLLTAEQHPVLLTLQHVSPVRAFAPV